jgi:hypothetical protein
MFPEAVRRDVLILLAAKLAALALIWIVFFQPVARPGPDSAGMRAHLLSDRSR